MAIKRRSPVSGGGHKIINLEPGEYEGRLLAIADLGLHEREYMGEKKPNAQKIALAFEVVDSEVDFGEGPKPRYLWTKPFNIGQRLTDLGNELKVVKKFKPDAKGGDKFDWDEKLLGFPVNLTIINEEKGDRVYDVIADFSAIPSKYRDGVSPLRMESCITGDIDDPDDPVNKLLFGLPKWEWDNRIIAEQEEEEPESDLPF